MSQAAADALVEEANQLFRAERFTEAADRFERATKVFPDHALAWKGLGHTLLCLNKLHDAARAFDRAIGLRPDSATALWGGAVAHADAGNKVVAQNYLRRALAQQPTWIDMARAVPQLAAFLQVSAHAADLLRIALGPFSTRTYRHASVERSIDIGRVADKPRLGLSTYVTIGLSNQDWQSRPRVELVMATAHDLDVCGQILANLAFHLCDTAFYPAHGGMVRDVVGAIGVGDLSVRLPHIYLRAPGAWSVRLPLDVGPPAVTLTQAVPVSEAEYQLWRAGVANFETALVVRGADLADLRRSGE
jgi:hypothetical protein